MRPILIAMATLLTFTFAVKAQIAAPRLHPFFPTSLFFTNPAILPWSGLSRIGGGFLDISVDAEIPPSPSSEVASGDGLMVEAIIVGETVAFGADSLSRSVDNTSGGGSRDVDTSLVSLALNLGGVFAIGAGRQTSEAAGATTSTKKTLPLFGVSLRLGEVFFLGAAAGTETISLTRPLLDGTVEGDRKAVHAGIGLLVMGEKFSFHLEAYKAERDDLTIQATATGIPVALSFADVSDGITAEVVIGGLFLGVEQIKADTSLTAEIFGVSVPINVAEVEKLVLALGWVREKGISIVASMIKEETFPAGGGVITVETFLLSGGWTF